jgi:hypothetical protein
MSYATNGASTAALDLQFGRFALPLVHRIPGTDCTELYLVLVVASGLYLLIIRIFGARKANYW